MSILHVGLIGYGYWGPNLARNFSTVPGCHLNSICDLSEARRLHAAAHHPSARLSADPAEIFSDPAIGLVLIATPVSSHFELARRALLAGKDVLVEKPLAGNLAQATELVDLACARQRILAVDHTFLYTGAVAKMKEQVDGGELGKLIYLDSVRVNLGLFQPDVNVTYDLAPHDLSVLCHLTKEEPQWLRAVGSHHHLGTQENQVYLHLEYASGLTAHFHWNWLAPVKLRLMSLCGSRKMIVYDDMEHSEKIRIYDKGINIRTNDRESIYRTIVNYRTGDMLAPNISRREALQAEAEHIVDCVARRATPLSDGVFSLRVMRLLDAAERSLKQRGELVELV